MTQLAREAASDCQGLLIETEATARAPALAEALRHFQEHAAATTHCP